MMDFKLRSGTSCHLVQIDNDFIPDYYVLGMQPDSSEPSAVELTELFQLGIEQAKKLAFERTKDREAFTVVYSGYSARRRKGWHVHIFLLGNRWKKARLYFLLSLKNLAQALKLRKDDAPKS